MKILAVDTALGACSVAVFDGDRVLAHRFLLMERGHAEALAPMVEEAMREAGIAFGDLDRLAVTTGPGTFTGQRVGLAFMRGLRVALKKPLAGITTLEAMAVAAMNEAKTSRAAVLHDAKRGEVYMLASDERAVLVPLQLARFDDAVAAIDAARRVDRNIPLAFAGTAGHAAAEKYRASGGTAILTDVRQPDALWVGRLGLRAPEPESTPKPLYLRAPDAKLPPDALRLRVATVDDVDILAALHAQGFAEYWNAQSFRDLFASGAFAFVAEKAGEPHGFILARVAADESEILTIVVAPAARRTGIGWKLIAAAAAKAHDMGARAQFLEVARENEAARALYGAAGFIEVGARPAYYRDGAADALVLKAKLPLPSLGKAQKLD